MSQPSNHGAAAGATEPRRHLLRRPGHRWLALALGAVLVILTWLVLAPVPLGGIVSYVTVKGTSMDPHITSGDLVLLHPAGDYAVGDVVAFRDRELGRTVLHRIVGRQGEGLITKGDNNALPDPDLARPDEVIGRLWIRVPVVGRFVAWARAPWGAAALMGLAGLLAVYSTMSSRRTRPGPRGGSPPRPGPRFVWAGPGAVVIVCVVGLVSLGIAAVAFNTPTHRDTVVERQVQQKGRFAYSAKGAPEAIYQDARVRPGDPLFTQAIAAVDVAFAYRLAAPEATGISGSGTLELRIDDGSGWRRTVPLAGPVAFSGDRATIRGRLDLVRLASIVTAFEESAGVVSDVYQVALTARVTATGESGGRPFSSRYRFPLLFQFERARLALAPSSDAAAQSTPARLEYATWTAGVATAPNRIGRGGIRFEVAALRIGSAVASALAILLALAASVLRAIPAADEPAHIRARYGHLLIGAQGLDLRGGIRLDGIDGLAEIADYDDRPILYEERGDEHLYFVEDRGAAYWYCCRSPRAGVPVMASPAHAVQ